MADKKTTLFELHMHGDAQLGPGILGGSSEEEREGMDAGEDVESEESSGGSRIPRFVMALVALVVISVAVRKIRGMRGGSGGEPIEVEKEDVKASA